MAKKKFKLDLGKILTLAAMVLALVAFFMMFAPAVEDKLTTTYSGAQVAFGYSKNSTKILVFSAYFIPYLAFNYRACIQRACGFGHTSQIFKVRFRGLLYRGGRFAVPCRSDGYAFRNRQARR